MSAAAAPPLAPDIAAGLRRLKLSTIRQLAPELLITAKTQRWAPEELLRTLIDAEITAREASNARTRMKTAAFPVIKTLDELDRSACSIPGPTLQVDQGSEITVRVTNSGEVETTVHWHGLRLENRYDGVPHETQEPIPTGGSFTYAVQFPDAGFYWYHPHLREDYAQEMGLYGTIVVENSDPNGLSAVRGWREPRGDDTVPASGYVCPMHPEVTASERQLCMESSPS